MGRSKKRELTQKKTNLIESFCLKKYMKIIKTNKHEKN